MLGELSNSIVPHEEWVHVIENRGEAYAHRVSVACPREQALVPGQVTWTGAPQLCPWHPGNRPLSHTAHQLGQNLVQHLLHSPHKQARTQKAQRSPLGIPHTLLRLWYHEPHKSPTGLDVHAEKVSSLPISFPLSLIPRKALSKTDLWFQTQS